LSFIIYPISWKVLENNWKILVKKQIELTKLWLVFIILIEKSETVKKSAVIQPA